MSTQTDLKISSKIILTCRENGHPVAGLLAMVTLETERKNPFHVFVGPTDSQGYASITREEILESIKRDVQSFQMDYVGPEFLTGGFQVMLLDTDRIQAALRAFELYRKHIPYPKNYAETLRKAKIRAMEVDTKQISVTVETPEGSDARIRVA